MRVVIQCANTKVKGAGCLYASSGEPVSFVARPDEAGASNLGGLCARPDDPATGGGRSWRDLLVDYNASASNSLGLVEAARLYEHRAYATLVAKFGIERVFILSAGWGLVRGTFRLPLYDITFSGSAESYKKRRRADDWRDFRHLEDTGEPIVLFGGKDYLPLFHRLTSGFSSPRTIYYRTSDAPDAPGCTLVRYETRTMTNWHYECAARFIEGKA
jgi:hypothetical protein